MRTNNRTMVNGDELMELLVGCMNESDGDIEVTVAPMRRDSRYAPTSMWMYRDGIKRTPDPLYAWFCWVECSMETYRHGYETDDRQCSGAFVAHKQTRDAMIAILDAAWAEDRREP